MGTSKIVLGFYPVICLVPVVNHGQTWKGWERGDTCKNQPKRLDSDNTINLSSLIVSLVFKVIRSVEVLKRMFPILDLSSEETLCDSSGTGHSRVAQAELLKLQRNGQFPDEFVKIEVTQIQIHYVSSWTY